jgi:hypothetical protein
VFLRVPPNHTYRSNLSICHLILCRFSFRTFYSTTYITCVHFLHGVKSFRSRQFFSFSFMAPESSLLHLQQPATCPFPKPDQYSLHILPILFLKIQFTIIHPMMPRSSQLSLFLKFPHQPPNMHLSSLISATYSAHLLDVISQIIFG